MSSFTRTIPAYKHEEEVRRTLSGQDGFIPLAFQPIRAKAGDLIYLVYKGLIAGRARIATIEPAVNGLHPDWAHWVVRYAGGWERPPHEIPVKGHQSIRYMETHALEYLDAEIW